MSKITRNNLHESLLNELDDLKNNGNDIDLTGYQEKIDTSLVTDDKSIVNAINQLYLGMEEVYDMTFNLKQRLVALLQENEIDASVDESVDSLLGKLEFFINSGGSGGSVNLEGGSGALPSMVVDNQLYVSTDNEIAGMVVSNDQPEIGVDIQEGGVWVYHHMVSEAFEYVICEDPLVKLFIYDCYQVVNGEFVKKDLYCGVNGEWVLVNGHRAIIDVPTLFDEDYINNLTMTNWNSGNKINCIKKNDIDGSIRLDYDSGSSKSGYEQGGLLHSEMRIDVTKYSKIIIQIDQIYVGAFNGNIDFGIYNDHDTATATFIRSTSYALNMTGGTKENTVIEVDVSDATGSYYFGAYVKIVKGDSNYYTSTKIDINRIIFE